MTDNPKEQLPIVDNNGNIIGKATRRDCHNGSMHLHPVVHLHLLSPHGELFLQLRPTWKSIQPGKWDTAVGGHIAYGEDIDEALRREAFEELGINSFQYDKVAEYIFQSKIETEYVYSFIASIHQTIKPSEETDGGRFWSIDDINDNLGKGVFTPNFEDEFIMLCKLGVFK